MIRLAAALVLLAPALVFAQPSGRATRVTGKVAKANDKLSVNGLEVESCPLLAVLGTLVGKNVTVRGVVAEGGASVKVLSLKAQNPSKERPVDVLRGPEEGAVVMKVVEPGHGIDVLARSRNGEWLKVRVEENDGESEPGWVKVGDLLLGTDAAAGVNAKRKVSGLVTVTGRGVMVNGVKVANEPFAQILRAADGKNVTVEGFVTRPAPGDRIEVTSLVAQTVASRQQAVKVRQRAEEDAPQLGAPVAAGQPLQVTGMTSDGQWYTTIVAEGDMRETGYVKVTELTVGSAPAPANTPGVNGSLRTR